MMEKDGLGMGTASPNLINICVDRSMDGEIAGKFYCSYFSHSRKFDNIVQLLRSMEQFYNRISFPQSAVQLRNFAGSSIARGDEEIADAPVLDRDYIIGRRGICATFLVHVQYRQNATWQGSVLWAEKEKAAEFNSALELIMIIDNILRFGALE